MLRRRPNTGGLSRQALLLAGCGETTPVTDRFGEVTSAVGVVNPVEVSAEIIYAKEIKADWIEADEIHAKEVKIGR